MPARSMRHKTLETLGGKGRGKKREREWTVNLA